MLLSERALHVFETASMGACIVGVIVLGYRVVRRDKLPRAIVRTSAISTARMLVPVLALPVGVTLFLWASGHDVEVLVIRDGSSLHYRDRDLVRLYGRAPLEFPLVAGLRQNDPDFEKPCWTLNRSSKPVRVVHVQYPRGYGHFLEKDVVVVPPGYRTSTCAFDYYGNMYGPPDTLEFATSLRFPDAWWITWEP